MLVMRDTTERPEALKSGIVHLVGTNHDLIVSEVSTLLYDAAAYERMSKAVNPYGDGKACSRIVRALNGEKVERYEVYPRVFHVMKGFLRGVWQFCSYLFWPQRRPKDYYNL